MPAPGQPHQDRLASAVAGATRRPRRALPWKLCALALLALLAAVLLARGVDLLRLLEQALALVRSAGPVTFFIAMAVLPACAVPMLAFVLPAVPLFSAELGLVPVLLIAVASLTVNIAMCYWLAHRAMRPLLARLLARLGYGLPQVGAGEVTDLIVMLRVTPGIPFFAQNYLAGLAGAAFGRYMLISCLIAWPLNVSIMLFGDALLQGRGRIALIALCVLVALTVVTRLVRRRYAAKHSGDPAA